MGGHLREAQEVAPYNHTVLCGGAAQKLSTHRILLGIVMFYYPRRVAKPFAGKVLGVWACRLRQVFPYYKRVHEKTASPKNRVP